MNEIHRDRQHARVKTTAPRVTASTVISTGLQQQSSILCMKFVYLFCANLVLRQFRLVDSGSMTGRTDLGQRKLSRQSSSGELGQSVYGQRYLGDHLWLIEKQPDPIATGQLFNRCHHLVQGA